MSGCSMDAPCISVLVFASMHGVRILGLICIWKEDPTWICTVSCSYTDPPTPSYYTNKSKNSGLPGGVSMCVPCIGALVCASTHGLHMVIIFGMWGEASAWICTVSWSYIHSHVPCGLRPQDPGSCAYGWLWHGCVLCKCVSDCQYIWGAYTGPYLHVGCVFNVDVHRILVIQTSPCKLLIAFRVQKSRRPRVF